MMTGLMIGIVVVVVLIAIVLIVIFVQIPVYIYVPAIFTVIVLGATALYINNTNNKKYIANNIATVNLMYKPLDPDHARTMANNMVNNITFASATTPEMKLSEIKKAYASLTDNHRLDVLKASNELLEERDLSSISINEQDNNDDMKFIQNLINDNTNEYQRIYQICNISLNSAVSTAISSKNIRPTRGYLRNRISSLLSDAEKSNTLTIYYISKFNEEIDSKITGDIGVYDKSILESDDLSDDAADDQVAREIVCYIINDIRAVSMSNIVNASYILTTIGKLLYIANPDNKNENFRGRIFAEVYNLLFTDDFNTPIEIQYNKLLADKRKVSIDDINIPVSVFIANKHQVPSTGAVENSVSEHSKLEHSEGVIDIEFSITSIVNSINALLIPKYITNSMQSIDCKNLIDQIEKLEMPLASVSVFDEIYDYIIGKYLKAVSEHNAKYNAPPDESKAVDSVDVVKYVCKLINFTCKRRSAINIDIPQNIEFRNNVKLVINNVISKYSITMNLATTNMLNYYILLLSYELMPKTNVSFAEISIILTSIIYAYNTAVKSNEKYKVLLFTKATSLLDDAFTKCEFQSLGKLKIYGPEYNKLSATLRHYYI